MEIITKEIDEVFYIPNILKDKINNKRFCFFDIETTGFSRDKSNVVLIGVLYEENNKTYIKQFFANNLSEEFELLKVFNEFILEFDTYISFNGDTFDIPFLNTKFKYHDINFEMDKSKSIDVMKDIKKNKDNLGLKSYKLKEIEKFLGINRDDKISGKESVDMYFEYIKSNDLYLKEVILRHNYDDIFYMPKIIKIYDLIEEYSTFAYNIIVNNEEHILKIKLDDIKVQGSTLYVKTQTSKFNLLNQIVFEEYYNMNWNPMLGDLSLEIVAYSGKLSNQNKCIYINKDNYAFNLNTIDTTEHNIPQNLLLIKEKSKLINQNLKSFLKEMIGNILKKHL